MNPLKALCVVAFLAAAVFASPNQNQQQQQQQQQSMNPSQWLSSSKLQQLPSLNDLTVESLENMSLQKGANLLRTLYNLAQIANLKPTYAPSASSIPVYIIKRNGQKVTTSLDKLANTAKQQPNFGSGDVTVFITGLPANTQIVKQANRQLVQSYMELYNVIAQKPQSMDYENGKSSRTSSDEASGEWEATNEVSGDLVIIDLGDKLTNMARIFTLDVKQVGAMIGDQIVQMTAKTNAVRNSIHILGQAVSAHVAGAAGQQYRRKTGEPIGRITALAPTEVVAKNSKTLTGLSHADAKFVDAIHTAALSMGTENSVGNVDFYPNGPSAGAPGAQNVVEAVVRATELFTDTIIPGNGENYPAQEADSLDNYVNNDGFGKRVLMGLDVDTDLEGNYILEINEQRPFSRRAPAQKQKSYHGTHKWQRSHNNDYDY